MDGHETTAEERALIEGASAGHVMGAIGAALRLGEMEAAVDLLGILATKDPHAAEIIVKAIQYTQRRPATAEATSRQEI